MSAEIALLLAAERSGTHYFRSMLEKVPGVKAPGEVCNVASDDIRTSPISFLRFRQEQCELNPDFFYTTAKMQFALLDRYFERVRSAYAEFNLILLDIKYPHVHNFNSSWWDFVSKPLLLDYATWHKFRIVHLVREKSYQTAISTMYAQTSGVWRTKDESKVATIRIPIDPTTLEARARQLAGTIRLFDRWLKNARVLRISYEELTQETGATLAGMAAFLGLEGPIPPAPDFVKTTPPYAEAIENFADIRHLLDRTIEDIDAAD